MPSEEVPLLANIKEEMLESTLTWEELQEEEADTLEFQVVDNLITKIWGVDSHLIRMNLEVVEVDMDRR